MAGILDYFSYGPQNPVLARVSALGQQTGVQAQSKKVLTIASQAGAPMRKALGYGERYNITQAQAGEIGSFFGSMVGGGGAVKVGKELETVATTKKLATIEQKAYSSEAGFLERIGVKEGTKAAEVASTTKKGITLTNVAKYGLGGAAIVGTGAVLYTGVQTAEDIIRSWGPQPSPLPMPPSPYPEPTPVTPPTPTPVTPSWPPSYTPTYPSDWLGYIGQGLGALPGGIGQGLGGGLEEIGAGIGGGIIPLAIIGGVLYYVTTRKPGKKKKK